MINGDYIMVIAPLDFPEKKYRGKYCYEHHLIYWKTYGIIPKDNEIIHHKDENKHNNLPKNLELKTRKNHSKEHSSERGRTMVELKCPYCENYFIKEKRQTYLINNRNYTCCSKKCSGCFTHLSKEEQKIRISSMFIKEFKQYF